MVVTVVTVGTVVTVVSSDKNHKTSPQKKIIQPHFLKRKNHALPTYLPIYLPTYLPTYLTVVTVVTVATVVRSDNNHAISPHKKITQPLIFFLFASFLERAT